MADAGELYDQDFLRWTEQQAMALRRSAKDSNLPHEGGFAADQVLGDWFPATARR